MSDTSLPQLDWRVVFNRAAPPGIKGWGRVRAAQIGEMRRALTIGGWAQLLNATLLLAILSNDVPASNLGLWVLSLAALTLVAYRAQSRWRGRLAHSASRQAVQRAAYHSLFFAIAWSVPSKVFAPLAAHPEQLAIAVVTAGMMAGAAFVLAPVPAAAAAYVLIVGGTMTKMLAEGGSPTIAAIGPAYTAGLLLIILANGRSFMQRQCERLALEERSDTIRLLLKEYESSDADWLWQTNGKLSFRRVSNRFARALGRSVDELSRMSILDLVAAGGDHPRLSAALRQVSASLEARAPFSEVVIPVETDDGSRCIEISARPQFDRKGRFVGYRGVGSDVTDAQRAADRIAHMARHDALTGMPNRLQLLETLGTALRRAQEAKARCAILLIDLDRFKSVNDSLGHVAGDHLLQQVSSRFEALVAPGMVAGRLGGDEFAVVVTDAPDRASLERLSRDIVGALSQPFLFHDQHLFVGASVGVALGPFDGHSVEELMRNADLALYAAKAHGGNDVAFYEPGLHARAEQRRRIELALRTALEQGELSLAYQPVVDARTRRIEGCEALLRWSNPELGDISPATFIPIAEETGLIAPIGEWVLRTALEEAASWPQHVTLAVNISPRQLQDPAFLGVLVSALSQSRVDPARLELEITETVFLNITNLTRRMLEQIRALGVRLAMDDFGTGYSSLGYLREADFDTLKIDRSFVRTARREEPESGAIVRAVVALAGSLAMTTVAEGVETEEQLEFVRDLGCDRIQGFVIAAPLAVAELRPLLAAPAGRVAA